MPLDSGAYLKSLGWQGSGNGLRQDGMAKPLAIPQKRTLSGVGKDRDEAFPFWDHVFNAAANSIKIKIHNDDSDQSDVESEQSNMPELTLSRTSTGIISNRRPASSTPGGSGSATPKDVPTKSRLNLLAQAKRQAAYARLYASFYKGSVITPLKDEISPAFNEKEETEKRYIHDITVDSQTNIPPLEEKDLKSCGMLSHDHSKKRKKKSSKDKLDKTETHLREDSNQSSSHEGKDKSTKKNHKKKRPVETEASSEHDLDNKKDPKQKRKSGTIGEEAEESTSKRKEGSKKRRLEDGSDNQGKRKKSKSKIDNGSAVSPEEYTLKPNLDKDEKRRERKSKERKKGKTS